MLEGKWKSGDIIEADYDGNEVVLKKGKGEIPAPRKRQSIAREAELITPIFGGGAGVSGGKGGGRGRGRGGAGGDLVIDGS